MEWFKNDQLLKFESSKDYQILDSGEIILTNLQPEDTGNYTCRIDNLQSSDRITYYLVVQGNKITFLDKNFWREKKIFCFFFSAPITSGALRN